MESIQDRAVALVYKTGLDDLVRQSNINYARWRNIRHKTIRISSEELDVLIKIFPQYAYWLASGRIAPEIGQTSPEYDEASKKLDEQNAV